MSLFTCFSMEESGWSCNSVVSRANNVDIVLVAQISIFTQAKEGGQCVCVCVGGSQQKEMTFHHQSHQNTE